MSALVCVLGSIAAEMNLQMDVDRAAHVPARVEGGEFHHTLLIGDLDAAQKPRCIHLAGFPSPWLAHTRAESLRPGRWARWAIATAGSGTGSALESVRVSGREA